MEVFEVHITGDESIHKAAKELNQKTIAIDLLRPDKSVLRAEHMTSLILKHESYKKCKAHVDEIVKQYESRRVPIIRVKIECPYYLHYRADSLYIESHFVSDEMFFPTSRNQRKAALLATDRQYGLERYQAFLEQNKSHELELCLYDSFVSEDLDWFQLYW